MEYQKVMGMNKLQLNNNMGEAHKYTVCMKDRCKSAYNIMYDISTKQGKLISAIQKLRKQLPWG